MHFQRGDEGTRARQTETAGSSGLARDLEESERNGLEKQKWARAKGGEEMIRGTV